jgi:hypothetical protein
MRSSALLVVLMTTALAGCATPYGEKLTPDYSQKQIPGSITVSDAKLYRREALINERRREVRYIDQLMANTEKDGFVIGPEVAREIEVIRAIALSGGLSVDPAAGRSYRDANKLSSIRQEMEELRAQLQLEQLKNDAALFREQLKAQTTPSRDDLGTADAATAAVAAPALTPADTQALITRIDALQETLAGRLGATVAGPRSVTLPGNPIDQFRDRAAYRQILTTARNAASLDELHDINGAALYRLTFQVTTLPPGGKYVRTAGIVEMRPVENSQPDDAEVRDIYLRWLDYYNQTLLANNRPEAASAVFDSFLTANQLFGTVQFFYDPGAPLAPAPAPAKAKGKGKAAAKVVAKPTPSLSCPGLASSKVLSPGCARIRIATPDFEAGSVAFLGTSRSMGDVVDLDVRRLTSMYDQGISLLQQSAVVDALLVPGACALRPARERAQIDRRSPTGQADTFVSAAVSSLAAIPFLAQALDSVADSASTDKLRTALTTEQARLVDAVDRASTALAVLGERRCTSFKQLFPSTGILVPKRFAEVVKAPTKVRVYEVGPREQVQQLSTAARAAEAFSLAMAIAAKDLSSGAAANAGLGLSRNAIGKADVVERLPVVVGYAQAGGKWNDTQQTVSEIQPRFGWLLGPRVNNIDPKKGALALQQGQKVYDLSADLSVSGWRTKLPLKVRTAWSPDWRSKDFVSPMNPAGAWQQAEVALNPSGSEFAMLTRQLGFDSIGQGRGEASIARLSPQKVKACAAATLILQGENLWRATDVIIGGRRFGGDNIAVLPDMRGITVELPANTSFADITSQKVDVQVLTPYGIARYRDPLVIDGYEDKGCDKAETKAEGPAVTGVSPDAVNICSSPTFKLVGSDLDKLTLVRFGAADGSLAAAAKAKERNVTFTAAQLATIATEFETMQFFAGDKPAGPGKAIRLVSRNCSTGKE